MSWPPADGTLYLPSNGTEGCIFLDDWCFKCRKDGYPDYTPTCAILSGSFVGEKHPAWVWRNGEPVCTQYDPEVPTGDEMPPEDPRQLTMEVSF